MSFMIICYYQMPRHLTTNILTENMSLYHLRNICLHHYYLDKTLINYVSSNSTGRYILSLIILLLRKKDRSIFSNV